MKPMTHLFDLLGERPECLHDGSYTGTSDQQVSERGYHIITKRCNACGTVTHVTRHDLRTGRITTEMDDTTELLYTRKGRLRIVTAALRDSGWDVPDVWPCEPDR